MSEDFPSKDDKDEVMSAAAAAAKARLGEFPSDPVADAEQRRQEALAIGDRDRRDQERERYIAMTGKIAEGKAQLQREADAEYDRKSALIDEGNPSRAVHLQAEHQQKLRDISRGAVPIEITETSGNVPISESMVTNSHNKEDVNENALTKREVTTSMDALATQDKVIGIVKQEDHNVFKRESTEQPFGEPATTMTATFDPSNIDAQQKALMARSPNNIPVPPSQAQKAA